MSLSRSNKAVQQFAAALQQLAGIPRPVPPYPTPGDPDEQPLRVELDLAILHTQHARLPVHLQRRISHRWAQVLDLLDEYRRVTDALHQSERALMDDLVQGIVDELVQATPHGPRAQPAAAATPPTTAAPRPAIERPPLQPDNDASHPGARRSFTLSVTAALVSVAACLITIAVTPGDSRPRTAAPESEPTTTPNREPADNSASTEASTEAPAPRARDTNDSSPVHTTVERVSSPVPRTDTPPPRHARPSRSNPDTQIERHPPFPADTMSRHVGMAMRTAEQPTTAPRSDLINFGQRGHDGNRVRATVNKGQWLERGDARIQLFLDNGSSHPYIPTSFFLLSPHRHLVDIRVDWFRPSAGDDDPMMWVIPSGQMGRGELLIRHAARLRGQSVTLVIEPHTGEDRIYIENLVFQ